MRSSNQQRAVNRQVTQNLTGRVRRCDRAIDFDTSKGALNKETIIAIAEDTSACTISFRVPASS